MPCSMRNVTKLCTIFVSATLLTLSMTCQADAVYIPIELTDEIIVVTEVDPDTGDFVDANRIGSEFSQGSFTANQELESEFVFEALAPVGGRYVVDPPPLESITILMQFGFNQVPNIGGGSPIFSTPTNVEFVDIQGTSPTLIHSRSRLYEGGQHISGGASFSVTAPFSFSGIRHTMDGPFVGTGLPVTYEPPSLIPPLNLKFLSSGLGAPQFVTFVPEPNSAMLLGMGCAIVGMWMRSRAT